MNSQRYSWLKIIYWSVLTWLHASFAVAANAEITRSNNLLEPEAKNYLSTLDEIKLCTGPDLMPLEAIRGKEHIGLNAEYMKLFSEFLKVPINLFVTSTWNDSMEAIKSGQCDIISLIAPTPEREEFLSFTQTYISIPFVLVTTQEKFFVSKLEFLKNKDLGVIKGYAYVELLKNRFPDINLIEVASRDQGLEFVSNGKLFGFLSGMQLAGYAIQQGNYTNLKLNGQFDELSDIQLGVGVRKNNVLLLDALESAIKSIGEHKHKQLQQSWIQVRFNIVEDYNRTIQVIVVAGIVLFFLAFYLYQLRKHNRLLEQREKEIWQQANFDLLTGFPNRRLFQDRLAQKITESHRNDKSFALLLVDLDEFKEINDTLGHDYGDELLIDASKRIAESLRKSDTVARLGGDEFVVILDDITKDGGAESAAQKIHQALAQPFILQGERAYISASIGITMFPQDAREPGALLINADQAMYAAKAAGRNNFQYFTDKMQQQALKRRSLSNDLRLAISDDQFEVYYQPIVDLKSMMTTKAEALLRWNHPEKGLISPLDFIPVLEDTRMIVDVGEQVFRKAAEDVKSWREQYNPNFQVSVNASPVQFYSQSTLNWSPMVKDIALSPNALAIEITESMLMEGHTDISRLLKELRQDGFTLSLDDFGTGYSSLSYLRRFDIDVLKIDKSFVRNLSAGSVDMALCEAIITMAHQLKLLVVAEGIETREQLNLLARAGCDFGQGYLFDKPMPQTEFEKRLAQGL